MIPYIGDFAEDETLYHYFNTFSSDDPSASVTITDLVDADLKVHKDGSTTEATTDGATISIDFDSITGSHLVTIDTSADAFYATGSDYMVRMEGTTIDSGTVNAALFTFSIENRYNDVNVVTVSGTTQTANDNGADINAILTDTGTTIPATLTTVEGKVDTVDTNVDSILVDTGTTIPATIATAQTDLDSLTDVLSVGVAAETRNDTLIEQLKLIVAMIEHQRGSHTHQPIGNVLFVDPTNGDTHASGNRGGITDPYSLVQDCHDNAVTDSNHDLIILLSGASGGATTLTEDVTLSKRYLFVRGPGRDFIWTRTGDGNTISITADGIGISGCQINTASGAASGNSVSIASADFCKIEKCWFTDVVETAIDVSVGSNYVITGNHISGCNKGVHINSGGGAAQGGVISENSIYTTVSHGIHLAGADASFAEIHHNRIWDIGNDGVTVNASCTDTHISHNEIGNCAIELIDDNGTDTVSFNNTDYTQTLTDIQGTTFDTSTDSLEAIRNRGDSAWITGGGGGITDILNLQFAIPNDIDLADTATVRLGLVLTNALDDLPSTAEIDPGTIDIDRKAIGGTSWSSIVSGTACSEQAGMVYYDEVFDSGTGYAEGDSIRVTFKSQKITVSANDYEVTDANGVMFQTSIRQTMRGTDSAATAAALTTMQGNVTDILADTGTTLPATLTTVEGKIDTVDTNVDSILVDTGTTLDAAIATIDSNVDSILTDTGTTLPATLATIDGNVDSVLTDTGTTIPATLSGLATTANMEARTPTAAQLAYITAHAATAVPVTFSGGSTTTAIFTNVDGSSASASDDVYNSRVLIFNAGTLDQQIADITDYVGSTTTATISAVTTAVTGSHTAIMV